MNNMNRTSEEKRAARLAFHHFSDERVRWCEVCGGAVGVGQLVIGVVSHDICRACADFLAHTLTAHTEAGEQEVAGAGEASPAVEGTPTQIGASYDHTGWHAAGKASIVLCGECETMYRAEYADYRFARPLFQADEWARCQICTHCSLTLEWSAARLHAWEANEQGATR